MKMSVLTRRWIDALRSGNYKQTSGCLKNDDGFCCLGVAADVMAPSEWRKTVDSDGYYSFRKMGDVGLLKHDDFLRLVPNYVQDRLDFSISADDLAELNDSYDFTFPMIADVVESWWSKNPLDPNDAHDRKTIQRKHGVIK